MSVIARSESDEAIQTVGASKILDCFASLAMTMGSIAHGDIRKPHSKLTFCAQLDHSKGGS
jgi:hypothetical protein